MIKLDYYLTLSKRPSHMWNVPILGLLKFLPLVLCPFLCPFFSSKWAPRLPWASSSWPPLCPAWSWCLFFLPAASSYTLRWRSSSLNPLPPLSTQWFVLCPFEVWKFCYTRITSSSVDVVNCFNDCVNFITKVLKIELSYCESGSYPIVIFENVRLPMAIQLKDIAFERLLGVTLILAWRFCERRIKCKGTSHKYSRSNNCCV